MVVWEVYAYYDLRIETNGPYDLDLRVGQQIYLRALRTIGNLTISYRHFLTHSSRMVLTGSNPVKKV